MTIATSPTESKRLAIDLRKKGYSYSEIGNFVSVPKSTLGAWLKKIKLTPLERERIRQKRIFGSRRGGEQKIIHTRERIEKIQKNSEQQVKEISERELWLLGIMLYWRERFQKEQNEGGRDLRKGVHLTSSDPSLIRLFLRWLFRIGHLRKEEIYFDIFLQGISDEEQKQILDYWARITGYPPSVFTHIYIQKKYRPKRGVKNRPRKKGGLSKFGILRIRVKASSMLARQISGWISGIKKAVNI